MGNGWTKRVAAIAALFFSLSGAVTASAAVEINRADQAELDGIRGIGPRLSRTILAERKSGGDFTNWSDLEKRVKGIKGRSARRLSDNGLTVNGAPRPGHGKRAEAVRQQEQGMQAVKGGS